MFTTTTAIAATTGMSTLTSTILDGKVLAAAGGLIAGAKLGSIRGANQTATDIGGISRKDALEIKGMFQGIVNSIVEDLNLAKKLKLGDEFRNFLDTWNVIDFGIKGTIQDTANLDQTHVKVTLLRASFPIPHSKSDSGRVEDFFKIFDAYYNDRKQGQTDIYTGIVATLDNLSYLLFIYLDQLQRCPGKHFAKGVAVVETTMNDMLCNFINSQAAHKRSIMIWEIIANYLSKYIGSTFSTTRQVMADKFRLCLSGIFFESKNVQRNLTMMHMYGQLQKEMLQLSTQECQLLLNATDELPIPEGLSLDMLAKGVCAININSSADVSFTSSTIGKRIQELARNNLECQPAQQQTRKSFDMLMDQGRFKLNSKAAPRWDITAPYYCAAGYTRNNEDCREIFELMTRAINNMNIAIALCNDLLMEVEQYGSLGMRECGDLLAYHELIHSFYVYSHNNLKKLFNTPYFKSLIAGLPNAHKYLTSEHAGTDIKEDDVFQSFLGIEPINLLVYKTLQPAKLINQAAVNHSKIMELFVSIKAEIENAPKLTTDCVLVTATNHRRAANIAILMMHNPELDRQILKTIVSKWLTTGTKVYHHITEYNYLLKTIMESLAACANKIPALKYVELPQNAEEFAKLKAQLDAIPTDNSKDMPQELVTCKTLVDNFYKIVMDLKNAKTELEFRERERLTFQAIELSAQVDLLSHAQRELNTVKSNLDKSEKSNQQALAKTTKLKVIIKSKLTKDVEKLHQEITSRTQSIDEIRKEAKSIDELISATNIAPQDKQAAQDRFQSLNAKLEALQESENATFVQKIAEIEAQKDEYDEDFEDIIEKIQDSVNSLNVAREALVAAMQNIDALKQEIITLRSRLEEVVSEKYDLALALRTNIERDATRIGTMVSSSDYRANDVSEKIKLDIIRKFCAYYKDATRIATRDESEFIAWIERALIFLHSQDTFGRSCKYKAWLLFKRITDDLCSPEQMSLQAIIKNAVSHFTKILADHIKMENQQGVNGQTISMLMETITSLARKSTAAVSANSNSSNSNINNSNHRSATESSTASESSPSTVRPGGSFKSSK